MDEFMTPHILEKMKILNHKLQNIQVQLFKIACEYDIALKSKLDNIEDPLKDYEINGKVYLTRDDGAGLDEEMIVLEQSPLQGITYDKHIKDKTEWILNANDHCDGGERAIFIKDMRASYLFHQLYYHSVKLEEEDVCRHLSFDEIVSFTMVDFRITCECSYWEGEGDEINIYGDY